MIIEYQKYSVYLKAKETIILPPYKGSTFRGGFGNSFRRVVCVFRNKNCSECPLRGECVYSYVFETPAIKNDNIFRLDNYEAVPHPFIIEPPLEKEQVYEPGSLILFNLILIGKAAKYLLYFIMAFEYLGELGIGKGRGQYELLKVEADGNSVYSGTERLTTPAEMKSMEIPEEFVLEDEEEYINVDFKTPTRLKFKREYINKIDFYVLITNLLRRLALLSTYHGASGPPTWNHRLAIEEAKNVATTEDNTRWFDWERYSHRQRTKMKLGGVVGKVIYRGRIKAFYPLLKAGEVFHVGKGTSFGLGLYKLG